MEVKIIEDKVFASPLEYIFPLHLFQLNNKLVQNNNKKGKKPEHCSIPLLCLSLPKQC